MRTNTATIMDSMCAVTSSFVRVGEESRAMRLIDIDEFEFIDYSWNEVLDRFSDTFDDGVMWLAEKIDQAPTIDAVPVVHGEWILDERHLINNAVWQYAKCSVCADSRFSYDSAKKNFNYCPNCGAKMDGKERNDD